MSCLVHNAVALSLRRKFLDQVVHLLQNMKPGVLLQNEIRASI